ncbi:FAD/NAD(P)-binding protein [Sphingomonas sp. SM33]|uniref:FAD/NAD(P)-binding protein n=1 Tax=Sphingomonas telluris TaxID=2907998 RepID=A0ABS9VNL1_9SPHN|nr:FAD/NAD(P)-binding protein [Sphingomonas telluris]MCH8615977.1 FAD/NAD(P)-binding protein [Sphingomonas telluris]
MKSDRGLPVAIIGGGFSGTIVAAQLARRGIDNVLIEGSGRAGRGVAYSTREPAHVLNVCADVMSAWEDDLDHFVRVAEAEGATRRDFVQRMQFGQYLRRILDEALATGRTRLVQRLAMEAEPRDGGWRVSLDGGEQLQASALVLALGNQPPEPLPFGGGSTRVIDNPWGPEALAAIEDLAATNEDVLLVGTGLTMVDAVLSLDAAGHQGRIVALSRRGLVPRGHVDFEAAPVERGDIPAGNVRALWRWLRRRSAQVGWRAAIDSLRPHSHWLWQSLPQDQRERFARHARPWWDVHRHRIAPTVAQRLHELIAEGRLQIVAGRIQSVREEHDALSVVYRRRGSSTVQDERFAYMINCTGPLGRIDRTRDALLKGMLADGLARPDDMGIALDVDEHSRIAGSQRAWAMGPLTKGRYWEIIAVPDIRGQAAAVAEDIAMELKR